MKLPLVALLSLLPLIAFCQNQESQFDKEIASFEQTFLLPIDQTQKEIVTLSVKIPLNTTPLQSLNEFSRPSGFMIEYIPENETETNWHEIITIHKFIGKRIRAIYFTDNLRVQLFANSTKGVILSKDSSKDKMIEKSSFVMQYINQGNKEIIGVAYFSGPYDAAGVQYTIKLKESQNQEEAVKKINNFFKNNVELIKSNL